MSESDDATWLAAVRAGHPLGQFGHREHLRLAWLLLEQSASIAAAQAAVSSVVKHLASAQGVPQRYNQTTTDAWIAIVAHCRADAGRTSFDELLDRYQWLLDKRILMRHYSSRTLASDAARRRWVDPDVMPIPAATG